MSKVNLNESPFSEVVSEEIKQKHAQFAEEVQTLMEKHGIETYLVTIKTKPDPDSTKSLYSAFIGAQDASEVAGLHMQAISTMQQYFRTQVPIPMAPGGIA